jgi:glycogen debranching enzyme
MKADSSVVHGSTFLVTDADGRQTRPHDGFYRRDTRHLNRYRLDSIETPLDVLDVVDARPAERALHLGSPMDREHSARRLHVARRQVVSDGLYERLTVSNLTTEPTSETLTLGVGTRFDDLFEVRGYHDSGRERDVAVDAAERRVAFRYDPDDLDATWTTVVTASDGEIVETSAGGGRGDAQIDFAFDLGPREAREVTIAVETDGPSDDPAAAYDAALEAVRRRERDWLASTREVSRAGWDAVLAESRENLLELLIDTEHGPVFAAGVPWFATAFGRDSLIAAYQALALAVEPAKATCRYLAAHQATEADAFRAAEPGKILHEIRFGEQAVRGEVPHSPYYGTVDATALFVVLVHEVWAETGDDAFVEELWENVEAALDWIDEYGDRDGDGFLEYPTDEGGDGGLTHQAWKDSGDGIMHPGGEHPEGPLAVAEAQGYAYDAKRRAARLARSVAGDAERADELERDAEELAEAFDEAFWLPDEEFYAIALDGNGDPVETVATNAGHCLWSGIVPEERADAVIDRLIAPDMFSGWGVRTVSAEHPVYNPQSYHLGSVWPHDSSLVALGMARYGRVDAAERIAEGLVAAATARGNDRLPELFAGFERSETDVPVTYGEACEPQAWAAAAPLACLRAVQGEPVGRGL